MSDLSWTNVTVKLSDLIPWGNNPKTSTGKNAQQLQTSRDELGQFQTVAIEPTDKPNVYQVADGHQRLSAWLAKYGKAAEIDARLASRPLTETERRKIAIYSRQIGAWDWDILSGWEPEELTGWGFDVDLLNDWRRDVAALGSFIASEADTDWGDAFGGLPDEDRAPFQQMTFTLHDEQAEQVKAALGAAKALGPFDSQNENSNGNALTRICLSLIHN